MAWIETPGEGDERLRELLDAARDPATGRVDHILGVHALHPEGLAAHLALYTAVMRGTPGLPKVDRELVAYVVSAANGCRY
jgi:alkylhydroperoxidase family enzyme